MKFTKLRAYLLSALLALSPSLALAADYGTVLNYQGASNPGIYTPTPVFGNPAYAAGTISLAYGGSSGKFITIKNLGATTAYNFNLPTTVGTAGQALLSGAGGSTSMTWGPILTTSTGTLTIANGKTFTVNNTLTLAGTDSTTFTFPSTTGTVAVLGVANAFTGANTSSDNLTFSVANKGIVLKQGANGRVGTFVCNGVTPVTVSNTAVAISDAIVISLNTVGGTVGAHPAIQTITGATGFTVACTAADTSTYNYARIPNAA